LVAANGYVTVAEQPPDAALHPGAPAADRTGHGRADDPHPY
jgi:hypothetical protein